MSLASSGDMDIIIEVRTAICAPFGSCCPIRLEHQRVTQGQTTFPAVCHVIKIWEPPDQLEALAPRCSIALILRGNLHTEKRANDPASLVLLVDFNAKRRWSSHDFVGFSQENRVEQDLF